MLIFYFVRHGESEANLVREFSNTGMKHGLTALGRQQIYATVKKLNHINCLAIFSSPLLRAIQSSEIFSNFFKIRFEIIEALKEFDTGILEGRSDKKSWDMYNNILNEWLIYENWDKKLDEGESYNDIKTRFIPFLNTVKYKYSKQHGSIIFIGHSGTFKCMLPLILSNVDSEFVQDHDIQHAGYVCAEMADKNIKCNLWDAIEI